MTKLILHLGFAKTGTTSLQDSLNVSRKSLLDFGVLYPETLFDDLHTMLIPYLRGTEHTPPYIKCKFVDETTLAKAATDAWDLVLTGIAEHSPSIIVLSSEHLGELTAHSCFAEAIDRLSELATDINIVAYVRSPSSEYISYAQEQLKAGRLPPRPDQMRSPRDRLENLMKIPGISMSVCPFQEDSLIGNDIRVDFATRFLPKGALEAIDYKRVNRNKSISAEAMAVLERYVRDEFSDKQGDLAKLTYASVRELIRIDREMPGFMAPRYKPVVAQTIHDNARDLDWLAENFGVTLNAPKFATGATERVTAPGNVMFRVRDFCVVNEDRFGQLLMQFENGATLAQQTVSIWRKRLAGILGI